MTGGPGALTIQQFLYAYILGDGSEDVHGVDDIDRRLSQMRAEVGRHELRTMTVVTREWVETITRCRSCPRDDAWPCTALREMAMPYARHPAYRQEWQIPRSDDDLVGAEDGLDRGN